MATEHGIEGLETILGQVPFPAEKEQILDRAVSLGADEEIMGALRAMPPVSYDRPEEVLRSVPMARSSDDERKEAHRAAQRQEHTKPGLAETMKDTGPVNPIEEETGHNRKS